MAEICIIESDKIVNGSNLMKGNINLIEWNSDLSKLENGQYMFQDCSNFATFTSNLSSLTDGTGMFYKCINLPSFNSDLSRLTDGNSMFSNCMSLTSFTSDLSSLTDGNHMFHLCYLDATSVKNIALTINKNVTNNPRIDVGVDDNITDDEQVKKDLGLIKHKGWDLWINGGNFERDYILPKYAGCTNYNTVKAKDANYLTNDIVNGVWSEHLPDLEDGWYVDDDENEYGLFQGANFTSFTGDLSSLKYGDSLFDYCTQLTSFSTPLPSLEGGYQMFVDCRNLTSWNIELPRLTGAYKMFYGCTNLISFNANLSRLEDGRFMFENCNKLESFSSDLFNLTDGCEMFYECTNLKSFTSNLSSLTIGTNMFFNCTSLESFSSDLFNLTDGTNMFYGCKLDTASVQNIADTINTPSYSGDITIGIGNSTPNTEETTAFNTIASKGWTVYVMRNGSSSSNKWNPTSLDGEEISTPIPFYAKPVQATEESASYIDSEGNFYNILGGNYIYGDDLSTYGMFTCEEDAAANIRLTKIER